MYGFIGMKTSSKFQAVSSVAVTPKIGDKCFLRLQERYCYTHALSRDCLIDIRTCHASVIMSRYITSR